MRENRPYGLEGGESGSTGLPYPYPLRLCALASLRLFLLKSLTRGHHPHPPTPQPLLPRAGEGEPRFYRDAEYEKKPEPCGATKAGVRRR